MKGTILIYGGYGGIGKNLAGLLHENGYSLHLVGRNENTLKEAAGMVKGGFTVGDVRDPELFPKVIDELDGELRGLVYAVGTINLGSIRRLEVEDFEEDFRVNALGAALAVKAAASRLKKGAPASVVFFSSVAAKQGFIFHSSMGMAKGAVNGLTLSLAAEMAPKVRVNCIAPSLTTTPLAADILANENTAKTIGEAHALKRLGRAEDIAQLAYFLLSDKSSWMTGQIVSVDGGRSTLRTTL